MMNRPTKPQSSTPLAAHSRGLAFATTSPTQPSPRRFDGEAYTFDRGEAYTYDRGQDGRSRFVRAVNEARLVQRAAPRWAASGLTRPAAAADRPPARCTALGTR
jgi:hypothetical protein